MRRSAGTNDRDAFTALAAVIIRTHEDTDQRVVVGWKKF
jgi:hypothetical protein